MHFFADCCFSSNVNSEKWWSVHSDLDWNSPPLRCSHRGENNGAARLRRGWEREGGQPAEEEAGGCLEVYFACSREPCGVSAILRHFLPRPLKITHRKTGWPAAAAAHQLELSATGSGGWCLAQTGVVTWATCCKQRFPHRGYTQQHSAVVECCAAGRHLGLFPLPHIHTRNHCLCNKSVFFLELGCFSF